MQDTTEHAFSVEAPKGWKVAGGMFRFGPLDPRAMVDMTSPDGAINLRLGDSNIPKFSVPTRTMIQYGFSEGKEYAPRGSRTIVAKYRPGHVFADLYGQARFGSNCENLELKAMRSLPPVHSAAQEGGMTTTAGEVIYRCTGHGANGVAYVYAETSLTQMQSVGVWMVTWLQSFIAPRERAPEALRLLLHSAKSFSINPEWERYQLRINGASAEAAMRDFSRNMAEITSRFERWESAESRQFQSFDDVINGITLTRDPVTGQQREVRTGQYSTNWINAQGTVVNSALSPGSSFHRTENINR